MDFILIPLQVHIRAAAVVALEPLVAAPRMAVRMGMVVMACNPVFLAPLLTMPAVVVAWAWVL
jgi:hypothetical protein